MRKDQPRKETKSNNAPPNHSPQGCGFNVLAGRWGVLFNRTNLTDKEYFEYKIMVDLPNT